MDATLDDLISGTQSTTFVPPEPQSLEETGLSNTFVQQLLLKILMIGPAVNSGIYIPYAIECQGQIIQMFDPIYHRRLDTNDDGQESIWMVDEGKQFDGRWFLAKRPFIVTGGELTLDMLDLSYKADSKTYDAPFQLKANNGIYLIDDFGRQKVSPSEVLNRWIVPMEKGVDYFNFLSAAR